MKVIVVGGGISGIAASYYLQAAGVESTIVEAGGRLGGRLSFGRLGERSISFGGKNIGSRYTEFRNFCTSFGVDDFEYFGINTSRVENGRLVSFDRRKRWTALYRLLSSNRPRDLWRFFRLAQRVRRHPPDGFADSPFFHQLAARRGNPMLKEIFGARFCRDWIRPMVVRMNGAESDEAYLSSFGSNLRVVLDSYDQLSSGMERLIEKFAATTRVMLNTRAQALDVEGSRVRGCVVKNERGQERRFFADAVCVALPAPLAAALVQPHAGDLAALLRQVRYFPVHVIVAQYKREIFRPEIRAVIFDESSVLSNAGAYGTGDLGTVRYTFSGRVARRLLAEGVDDGELLTRAEQTLNPYVPVGKSDRTLAVSRTFDPGLCAFTMDTRGLNRRLDSQASLGGVFFTGDYRKGASIEACFVAARECAGRMASAARREGEVFGDALSLVPRVEG
jgi:protoporphyrinogen/coproporphyrinogen III oxidase